MSNKVILNHAAALGGFFLLANGVSGIVQNKEYSVPKILISVAALSYAGYKNFQSDHQKMKNRLDRLFSSKTILTKGHLLFWDSKSKVKGFGSLKQIFWTEVLVDQEAFKRCVPNNIKIIWEDLLCCAVKENLVEGKTIKEAVLSGISKTVLRYVPDFFDHESVRFYAMNGRLSEVFSLKFCHDLCQEVYACQSDEAVLDVLQSQFQNKNSLFYNCCQSDENVTSSFLNRQFYDSGNERALKVCDIATGVSMIGCGAGAFFLSPFDVFIPSAALAAGISLWYSASRSHLNKQISRFETKSFELSEIELKKPPVSENDKYVIWYQHVKKLTKMEKAKLTYQTALVLETLLKSVPKEMSCRKAGDFLFVEGILKNKKYYPIYNRLLNGATLEKVAVDFGLKDVYQMLMFHCLMNEVKKANHKEVCSFLFEYQSKLLDLKEKEQMARRKITKRAYDNLKTIEKLYQKGDLTTKERSIYVKRVLEMDETGVFMHVPVQTKLPSSVMKVLKEDRARK
ncbi:MAG: hypothetical protein J6V53_01030 [Alphaproteobacteria bacterium]|nr:hypothetical protein [Alphaproteobacteria bacterium]